LSRDCIKQFLSCGYRSVLSNRDSEESGPRHVPSQGRALAYSSARPCDGLLRMSLYYGLCGSKRETQLIIKKCRMESTLRPSQYRQMTVGSSCVPSSLGQDWDQLTRPRILRPPLTCISRNKGHGVKTAAAESLLNKQKRRPSDSQR
jgi:hypothetical protein